jgi:aminoglycoside phosphotransferase
MSTAIGVHTDRPVRMERRDGRTVVVKRYLEADGARIFDDHHRLWAALGTGRSTVIPEPFSWDDHSRELTMEAVAGEPVGARGDLGRAAELAAPIAALIADVHRSSVVVNRRRDARRVVASLHRKSADMRGTIDERRYRRAVELLDDPIVIRRVTRAEQLVLSHGDWSPRNVLADGNVVRIVDFDRLQMAGAAHDVAYWGAWCWATELTAGGRPNWTMCGDFMAAYGTVRPDAFQEVVDTLWFHRAAALLRIAHGWSVLQAAPLMRRMVIAEAVRWAAQA